ncbi:AAA family ATPase [Desulfurococcaceae archaeon MEX13E-LK6-19]|nr:AAA family ATPase [Desulfurococcaceae archaeon MEX13E-LK6-19]
MSSISRSPLGIDSFDAIIEGGFPRGSLVLVAGHPGAGKTIFAATYLFNGAVKYGEKGLYISFVEDKKSFTMYMKKLGLDFSELEEKGLFYFMSIPHADIETNMESVVARIMKVIKDNDIKRVVLDSITAILQTLDSPSTIRAFLRNTLIYGTRVLDDVTTLVIADLPYGIEVIGYGVEEFVVDGVLVLKAEYTKGTYFRWIEIRKMRGTAVRSTVIPYTIGEKGFAPIVYSAKIPRRQERTKKGLKPLTRNLSKIFSLIPPGSITLITGSHGSGKSVLALEYALNAVLQGEKALYISYNEYIDSLNEKINYLLKRVCEPGREPNLDLLTMKYIDPFTSEISKTMKKIQELIMDLDPGLIVFDGVEVYSGLIPHHIYRFINRDLSAYIKDTNKILVQTLLANLESCCATEYQVFQELGNISDTIINLKHDPKEPSNRILTVIKSRSGYTKQLRERLTL